MKIKASGWRGFFPKTDLSEYLRTRQLLDAWYVLAGRDWAALVDTVKPRVFKFFAFGRFGTMQQILVDMDCFQESGRRGIRPFYLKAGKRFTPLKDKPYVFEDTPSESIKFDSKVPGVMLRGIQAYDPESVAGARMDLDVAVEHDALAVEYQAPAEADSGGLEIDLYPLYTDYQAEEWEKPELIDYYCWDSRHHNPAGVFAEEVSDKIILIDRHGRMPRLTIDAPGAALSITAFCDAKRNDAHRLLLSTRGGRKGKIKFTLGVNPVVVHTPPIVQAGRPHRIEISGASRPRVQAAGKDWPVQAAGKKRWTSRIKLPHGVSRLLVETKEGVSDRTISAAGNISAWVEKMGRAAAGGLWAEGPVAGLMPQFMDVKRLTPKTRGPHGKSQKNAAYCSHNPRALMIIAAAARQTGDRKLLEKVWGSIKAMVRLAYKHDDGALVLPIFIYPDGSPGLLDAVRPSDPVIAIRSILMVRSVFLARGETKLAEDALQYACGFARALLKMAGPEGQLEARYRYPTLEVTHKAQIPGRGTVNNWVTNIWELAEILNPKNDPLGKQLQALCLKHADLLIKSKPSVLRLAGGGEDGPNNSDALCATAGFFLVKYLCSKEEIWKERAEQAFLMAALSNTIVYIDQPQNYFFTFDWTESIWHDGPMGVMSKGGMHDLTSCDVGLALAYYLKDEFARDMCAYQFLARVTDGIYENGVVLSRVTAMPNFQYVKTDFAETLNFGAVGVMAFYQGRNWRRLADKSRE